MWYILIIRVDNIFSNVYIKHFKIYKEFLVKYLGTIFLFNYFPDLLVCHTFGVHRSTKFAFSDVINKQTKKIHEIYRYRYR